MQLQMLPAHQIVCGQANVLHCAPVMMHPGNSFELQQQQCQQQVGLFSQQCSVAEQQARIQQFVDGKAGAPHQLHMQLHMQQQSVVTARGQQPTALPQQQYIAMPPSQVVQQHQQQQWQNHSVLAPCSTQTPGGATCGAPATAAAAGQQQQQAVPHAMPACGGNRPCQQPAAAAVWNHACDMEVDGAEAAPPCIEGPAPAAAAAADIQPQQQQDPMHSSNSTATQEADWQLAQRTALHSASDSEEQPASQAVPAAAPVAGPEQGLEHKQQQEPQQQQQQDYCEQQHQQQQQAEEEKQQLPAQGKQEQQQQQHQQQQQAAQQHNGQLQAQGQQQQAREQQQQQGPVPSSDRPWGWWRQSGSSSMWQGLDHVRLPLLQAHAMLGGRSSSSPHLLSLLGGPGIGTGGAVGSFGTAADAAAAAAAGSNADFVECWQQLHAAEAKHASQQQRQQQRLLAQARARNASSVGPPGSGMLQHNLPQPMQARQLQESRLKRTALASAAGTVPAAAAGDGSEQVLPRLLDSAAGRSSCAVEAAAAEPQQQPAKRAAAAAAAGAARPPMPKPPKRPWQPKMAADEPNWNKAAFSSAVGRCSDSLCRVSSLKALRPLPHQDSARFVALVMLHGAGWPNHLLWERWQEAHPEGQVALMAHMKAGVNMIPTMRGRDAIARHRLKTCVNAVWGDISLVQAQLDSLAEVLRRCPAATHIAIASGHDIPLQLMQPGLLLPGVSMFGAYQFGEKEGRALKVAALDQLEADTELPEAETQAWGRALLFHHQWMVLSREHAAALVGLAKEIMVIGRVMHRACNSVGAGMAPDEFILLTALRAHGYVRSIQRVEVKPGMAYPPGTLLNSYPTLVLFPAETSPHPVLWTDTVAKIKCQVEDVATREKQFAEFTLQQCLNISVQRCSLFFRKVEIRQTDQEQLATLLSLLEELWAGRGGGAGGGGAGAGAGKASSRGTSGGSSRKGSKRRRQQSLTGSKGPVSRLLREVGGDNSSPAGSSAADTAEDTDSGGDAAEGDEAEQQHPAKRAATVTAKRAATVTAAAACLADTFAKP